VVEVVVVDVLEAEVVLEVVDSVEHGVTAIVFICIVTAFCAKTPPSTVAPVPRAMPPCERIVPWNEVVVPRVAAVAVVAATCQKTLQACAPFSRITRLPDAVVSVLEAWKI
jgi:hypothetical protein